MKTKSSRACPVCGTPFVGEWCPVCVLRGALGNEQSISESPTEPALSSSQLRFEHYQVLTLDDGTAVELGRGAMGVTYKALDVNLRCAVALKVINARFIGDESARRRFMREARAAASVRHTNVASVFHLGKSGDSYFYVMHFVDGEALEKLIQRFGHVVRPPAWFPGEKQLDESIPERARSYLEQAISSVSAPSGAVMLAASTVDAMFTAKGYKEGTLNTRIEKAKGDNLTTAEMAEWTHEIRLNANDQRHDDEESSACATTRCCPSSQSLKKN